MSHRDEETGCAAAVASLMLGIIIGFVSSWAAGPKTPAQAWVQYVEFKSEHERVYLEGLK